MLFEDAVKIAHDLSEKLEQVVELKGDLVMLPESTAQARAVQAQIDSLALDISFLLQELERVGKTRIMEELQ